MDLNEYKIYCYFSLLFDTILFLPLFRSDFVTLLDFLNSIRSSSIALFISTKYKIFIKYGKIKEEEGGVDLWKIKISHLMMLLTISIK